MWKIPAWGSGCLAAFTREAAAIPAEMRGVSGSVVLGMGQPAGAWACLWSERMKYSMKITLSPWLDSSSTYRTGEVINFVGLSPTGL